MTLRRVLSRRVLPHLVLFGALGLAMAGCGGSSATTSDGAATGAPNGNPGPPGATGTIAAVAATSFQVQSTRAGQVTVNFSGSTTITKMTTGSASDVAVGDCVTVAPDQTDGNAPGTAAEPVLAATVAVSPAAAQGCRPGMAFGGGGGAGMGARPSGAPRPSGANGAGGGRRVRGTFGTISAVSANGFTVQETSGTAAVTTSPSTVFLKTQTADRSALVVGQCATAVGQADSGTVTATAVSVRAPGPNGCVGPGTGGSRG
ncbi:MAG TPA: DUF5666 domain-containing protein [Pseudonocardia sp.]